MADKAGRSASHHVVVLFCSKLRSRKWKGNMRREKVGVWLGDLLSTRAKTINQNNPSPNWQATLTHKKVSYFT